MLCPAEKVHRIYAVARMKCQRAAYADNGRRQRALEELAQEERCALASLEEGTLENELSPCIRGNSLVSNFDLVASTWKI